MLFRFSLYGFLKNQRYFEPFLLLALLSKGLSYTTIGLLIGFREICINVMEVPTGAVADLAGRRRAMILSFLAYIASFALFGLAGPVWMFFAAMGLFAVGEAFRTGTHKAIIFDWLSRQGRATEKTKVYGYTRSWSKIGSAVSVAVAAALMFVLEDYDWVFWLAVPPCALNIVNFLTYPSELDGPRGGRTGIVGVLLLMLAAFRKCLRRGALRRLLSESMAFEGIHKVSKDYIQPVIKTAALSLPVLHAAGGVELSDLQRTAVLVGAVYVVLDLLSSAASRRADAFVRLSGSEARGARWIWLATVGAFAVMTAGLGLRWMPAAIAAFLLLAVMQNFWRPIMVGRVADQSGPDESATILSIESQAKSLFAAVLAPLLGLAVDLAPKDVKVLPVAAAGLLVSLMMLATSRR